MNVFYAKISIKMSLRSAINSRIKRGKSLAYKKKQSTFGPKWMNWSKYNVHSLPEWNIYLHDARGILTIHRCSSILRRYLPSKLRHLICLRITVHTKTRQRTGFEGMVHEHPERYRDRPPGGGKEAGRRDVRISRWYRRMIEKARSLVASLCFISGNDGFAIPEALNRGSTRWNSAMRRKSRSCRSPILKFENRARIENKK